MGGGYFDTYMWLGALADSSTNHATLQLLLDFFKRSI